MCYLCNLNRVGALARPPLSRLFMENNEQLLALAANAAIEAGGRIMEVYLDPSQDFGIETKADNSPLTRADRLSDKVIGDALATTAIGVLSEESLHAPYEERRGWERLWIVDPLDGTKEFIKKNGDFTVNIALAEGGRPTLGVIYVPATGELFWGLVAEGRAGRVDGVGAGVRFGSFGELASASVALPACGGGRPFTVVASRSHINAETKAYIDALAEERPGLQTVSRGSSLKLCMVAEGKADAYPRFAPTMEWDTAAGQAIAEAAGCEVVRADDGRPLIYNKEDLHNPWFIVRRKATDGQSA